MSLVAADRLTLKFVDQVILDQVSFTVTKEDRIGLVGRNGSGKTTLFEVIIGLRRPDDGLVNRARGCLIDYARQELNDVLDRTLFDFVASARDDLLVMRQQLADLEAHLQVCPEDREGLTRLGHLQSKFEMEGGFLFENEVTVILEGLGFERSRHRDLIKNFSGGERNRAGLARVLAGRGNLLLLDEPTNHLDIESTRWLEGYLRQSERAYVVVSHDRAFLTATVDKVWELRYGKLEYYAGGFEKYVQERSERRRLHEHHYRHQQEEIKRLEEFIRRNMAGQKTKQAQSKLKYLSRIKRLPPPREDQRSARIAVESSGRSYAHVLAVESLAVGHGSEPVADNLSFDLYRGDKVGLIGRNGSGKSTLLKTLIGELSPIRGEIELGSNLDVAYFDQELSDLSTELTVQNSIWEIDPTADNHTIRSYLARFGFSGEDVEKSVAALSGGEKTKLALARLLYFPANFIIFDEPTNHLDMDSRERLEEALGDYDGTCLIVSHDRYFLDRVVNRILHLDCGSIRTYEGNYSFFREKTEPVAERPQTVRAPKSRDAFLAFKEESRRRSRLAKQLRVTRERIEEIEAEIAETDERMHNDIASDDWQALTEVGAKKVQLEDELLHLYALLEQLEAEDAD